MLAWFLFTLHFFFKGKLGNSWDIIAIFIVILSSPEVCFLPSSYRVDSSRFPLIPWTSASVITFHSKDAYLFLVYRFSVWIFGEQDKDLVGILPVSLLNPMLDGKGTWAEMTVFWDCSCRKPASVVLLSSSSVSPGRNKSFQEYFSWKLNAVNFIRLANLVFHFHLTDRFTAYKAPYFLAFSFVEKNIPHIHCAAFSILTCCENLWLQWFRFICSFFSSLEAWKVFCVSLMCLKKSWYLVQKLIFWFGF